MDEEPTGHIRWDFSLGNIVNLVALAGAGFIAWGSMTERSDATHQGLSHLTVAQKDIETRVRDLETGQARSAEKLESILKSVERIEAAIEKRR
jgi:hypothetical protein